MTVRRRTHALALLATAIVGLCLPMAAGPLNLAAPAAAEQPDAFVTSVPPLLTDEVLVQVFHDLNADGVWDANEPTYLSGYGARNVYAQVHDCSGAGLPSLIETVGRNGRHFTHDANSVRVEFTVNSGDPLQFSTGADASGTTACIERPEPGVGRLIAVGVVDAVPAQYGDGAIVWGTSFRDDNGDGLNNWMTGNNWFNGPPYYTPVDGWTETIVPDLIAVDVPGYNPGDVVVAGSAMHTNFGSEGWATGVPTPGVYRLSASSSTGDLTRVRLDQRWGNKIDPTTRLSDPFVVGATPSESPAGQHTGTLRSDLDVSFGGFVWVDSDLNGIRDPYSETQGITGVGVELIDCVTGNVIASAVTDNGGYGWSDLPPGAYATRFSFDPNIDWAFSPQFVDDGSFAVHLFDSDMNLDTRVSDCVETNVSEGSYDQFGTVYYSHIDAGALAASVVTGIVWNDLDLNGEPGADEPVVPGSPVTLISRVQDPDDGSWTEAVVAVTTTGPDGIYHFEDVPQGRYRVVFDNPADWWTINPGTETGSGVDLESVPAVELIGADGHVPVRVRGTGAPVTANAGAVEGGVVSDRVWNDYDRDGIQDAGEPGLGGATVELWACSRIVDPNVTAFSTSNFTRPCFPQGEQPAYDTPISGTVEAGAANCPSNMGPLDWSFVGETVTAPDGSYSFEGVHPVHLYTAAFIAPPDFTISPADQGDADDIDSDADPDDGTVGCFNLIDSRTITSIDAGMWSDTPPPASPNPNVEVAKTSLTPLVRPGGEVTFEITATNTGDVPLVDVVAVDPLAPDCDATFDLLAVGASETWTCEMEAPADDFINTVLVTGTPDCTGFDPDDPACEPVDDDDDEPQPVIDPAIEVTKTAGKAIVRPGEIAPFTITVTNLGDVDLHRVVIDDDLAPECSRTFEVLEVGESNTWTCSMPAPNTDFVNTATATGEPCVDPDDPALACEPVDDGDDEPQPVINPAIEVSKVAEQSVVRPGGTAVFTLSVTNSGDVDLHRVVATDDLAPECSRTFDLLPVGGSETWTCEMEVPSDQVGDFVNSLTGTGDPCVDPDDPALACEPVDDGDDEPQPVINPGIEVSKTSLTPSVRPGETVVFEITASNTGDVDLIDVVAVDPLAPDCDATFDLLAVGASETWTCEMEAPADDFINTVFLTGTPDCADFNPADPACEPITTDDPEPVPVIDPPPAPPTPPVLPPPAPPVEPGPTPEELPRTGFNVGGLLVSSGLLVLVGVFLVFWDGRAVARRRTSDDDG